MVSGRQEDWWWHTAAVRETIANASRGPKQQPYRVTDFYPFAEEEKGPKLQADQEIATAILGQPNYCPPPESFAKRSA